MLTIRKQQMDLLEAHMAQRFRESLKQHLRQELRDETRDLSDAVLVQRMDAGVARGRQYGMSTERDLKLFVDLDFALSPNFENQRDMVWAKRILLNHEMEAAAKMDLIYQRLAARQAPPETSESNS